MVIGYRTTGLYTAEARVTAPTGAVREERAPRLFGPIIRKGGCTPKVYVVDPHSGKMEAHCGGAGVSEGVVYLSPAEPTPTEPGG